MYSSFSRETLDAVEFIIVDDGSKDFPLIDVIGDTSKLPLNIEIYTIEEDLPWNLAGARNLGVLMASNEWVYISDADVALLEDGIKTILSSNLAHYKYYIPNRVSPNGKYYRPHPACFFIHQSSYWAVGGYDEDFSGYYGNDENFKKNLSAFATRSMIKNVGAVMFNDVWPDSQTSFSGKARDSEKFSYNNPKLRRKIESPPYRAIRPLRFSFKHSLTHRPNPCG